jgi:FkbM family methyltransferase
MLMPPAREQIRGAGQPPGVEYMLEATRRFGKEALLRHAPGVFWAYVRARHGHLEPEMALLPRLCRPDRTSVDVGANYGIYSYYMLKYSRACAAFEPYPHLAELLRRGLGDRLQVHEVALSDHTGAARMTACESEMGYNTIEPSNKIEGKVDDPRLIVTLEVPVRRLDEFDLGAIGFVKIDVEGHEESVLRGAVDTIASHRPAMLIEMEERHRAGSRERVARRLEDLGYAGFYFDNGKLLSLDSFDPARNQNLARPDVYIRNFIFLPDHRIDEFAEYRHVM